MAKQFAILGFILFVSACKSRKSSIESSTHRSLILIAEEYCGGAAPSMEMLEDLAKPKPYKSSLLYWCYLDSVEIKIIDLKEIFTDKNGFLEFENSSKEILLFFEKPRAEKSAEEVKQLSPKEREIYECEKEFYSQPNGIISSKNFSPLDTVFMTKMCNHCRPLE